MYCLDFGGIPDLPLRSWLYPLFLKSPTKYDKRHPGLWAHPLSSISSPRRSSPPFLFSPRIEICPPPVLVT